MTAMDTPLPPLPFAAWRPSKETLHLYTQIAGKIRMAFAPKRNHWWHATLRVSPRGLTTGLVPHPHNPFEIEFDLVSHGVSVRTADGSSHRLALHDGLTVSAFLHKLLELLHGCGVMPSFRMEPYDLAFAKQPFAEDQRHKTYDAEAVARFCTVLRWVAEVYEQFAGGYQGKTSPVQFFWHSFDLAVTASPAGARPRSPMPIRSSARPTRTKWRASASGPATTPCRRRRSMPTRRRCPRPCASNRSSRPRSGTRRAAWRS
jgi:hypothetical protein